VGILTYLKSSAVLLVLCFSVLPNAWAGKASWNKLPPEVQDALIDEVDACGTNVPLFVAKMSGYIHDSQRQYRLAFPLMHERVKEFLKSECRDGNFKEACKDNLAAGCSTDANLNRNSCYAHWLGKLKDDVRVLIA
jgi:hypothetical protein